MYNQHNLYLRECFQLFLPKNIEQLAKETGFIKRERQFSASDFLSLVFRQNANLVQPSLNNLCHDLENHNINITKSGLNKRFTTEAVDFFKALFDRLFQYQFQAPLAEMMLKKDSPYKRIRIIDSTSFKLPKSYENKYKGTRDAGAKIQFEFDYLSEKLLWFNLDEGKAADSPAGFQRLASLEKGDLFLQDLGYYHLDLFEQIHLSEAFYLSRARMDSQFFIEVDEPPRHPDGSFIENKRYQRLCMEEELKTLPRGQYREWNKIYVGRHKKMLTRCIIYRHDEEQEAKNIKKRNRSYQKKSRSIPKENVAALAGLTMYITNLPPTISVEKITQLYRVRWQIELRFKTWKSHLKLHQIKDMKIERWLCHVYCQCIVMLLSMITTGCIRQVVWKTLNRFISEDLSIRMISRMINRLVLESEKSVRSWSLFFKSLIPTTEKFNLKSTKPERHTLFI